MIVVMRLKQFLGFDRQVLVLFESVRGDLEIFLTVGEYVQANDVRRRRRKVDPLEMNAGIERRVHQRVQRGPFERQRGTVLPCGLQRGCVLPAFRKLEGDVEGNAAREESRGIED